MTRLKPYALGFLVAGLAGSSVMMTVSLLAWQAKGGIEWGLVVMALGAGVKWLTEM